MRISAIIVALNEEPFIEACVRAIYPFVDRIHVQTNYDRMWTGAAVEPDSTVPRLLRLPDPDGKISVLVRRLPDEALARDMLMRSDRYDLDHRHRNTTNTSDRVGALTEGADYFWVIDADEIYDPATIPAILAYLERRKPTVLRIRGINYFKTWNWAVHPSDRFFQPGFVRAGVWFQENRRTDIRRRWSLLFNRRTRPWIGRFEPEIRRLLSGDEELPEDVGVFHHAAYVGDDARIRKKLLSSVHYDARMHRWFDEVWSRWTPEMRDIHPVHPSAFPGVRHVASERLPASITRTPWPDGWIEPEPRDRTQHA